MKKEEKLEIQLSSGQGPAECELAVGKLLLALQKEFADIEVLAAVPGAKMGTCRSVRIVGSAELAALEGTVKWVCESPYRPGIKRKNWFVDVSLCHKVEAKAYNEKEVRFETFRCGGKGGQHVNKVETGVRAVHIPTGLAAESREARSQHMNRGIALSRLCNMIATGNMENAEKAKALNRLEHTRLERGNPVRVYKGMEFTCASIKKNR